MSDLAALGSELREARLRRELTLQQAERTIHIRAKFLEALEQGQPAMLPSPVQGRGFLRNYARYLGFDGDAMVARWDEALPNGKRRRGRKGLQAPPDLNATPQARPGVAPIPQRRKLRLGLVILALVVVLAVGGLAFAGIRLLQANIPAEGSNLILSPIPTEAPFTTTPETTATPPRPTPLPPPVSGLTTPTSDPASGDVSIRLEIVSRTWLRVTVDGQEQFTGMPGPDAKMVLQYRGNEINIRASNAAGLHATVNNLDLGVLGARGQIYDQTFTAAWLAQQAPAPTATLDVPVPKPPEPTTPAPG